MPILNLEIRSCPPILKTMNDKTRGADKIISSLTAQITDGKLKSGDRLPAEAKLCDEYDVSRTVVREAIQQMKAMGVIHTITGSGSYITEGNLDGLKNSLQFYATMTGDTDSWVELLEMRILLEASCARKLAGSHYSQKVADSVEAALEQMNQNKDDLEKFAKLDVKFHQILIQASGNKIFSAVILALENLQQRFSKETYLDENTTQIIERNFNEHKAIVDAIINRDPDAAKAAMETHLSATMENVLHYISKNK